MTGSRFATGLSPARAIGIDPIGTLLGDSNGNGGGADSISMCKLGVSGVLTPETQATAATGNAPLFVTLDHAR
jgi:hypothetical protein